MEKPVGNPWDTNVLELRMSRSSSTAKVRHCLRLSAKRQKTLAKLGQSRVAPELEPQLFHGCAQWTPRRRQAGNLEQGLAAQA